MALVKMQDDSEHIIKPEKISPTANSETWSLLLKNYEQCKSIEQTRVL